MGVNQDIVKGMLYREFKQYGKYFKNMDPDALERRVKRTVKYAETDFKNAKTIIDNWSALEEEVRRKFPDIDQKRLKPTDDDYKIYQALREIIYVYIHKSKTKDTGIRIIPPKDFHIKLE